MSFLKVVESVDDVLESVHVISVNVPISEVPVAGVLDVPDVILHDLPGDVLAEGNVSLQHGHLQLTQHLQYNTMNEMHDAWSYTSITRFTTYLFLDINYNKYQRYLRNVKRDDDATRDPKPGYPLGKHVRSVSLGRPGQSNGTSYFYFIT